MEIFLLGFFVFIVAIVILYYNRRLRELETDLDGMLSTIAGLTMAVGTLTGELEKQKEALSSATEALAVQTDIEVQWNKGLNNILNYSLAQAFEAGGEN